MNASRTAAFVLLAVLALGAVLVARQFHSAITRPGVQRELNRRTLQDMAKALTAYRGAHHAWPDNLFQLFKEQGLQIGANRGYTYRKPPDGAGDEVIVMWSEAWLPGAKRGEPWTESAVADHDIPPVAMALDAALRIEELPLDEAAKRLPKPPRAEAR